MLNAMERRRRAIRAAEAVAERFDIRRTRPVILQDRNHTLVHLSPAPVVAKVSVEKIFRQRSSSLSRELAVARVLTEAGASVLQPSTILPPGPYAVDGVELTFWTYCSGSRPTDAFHGQ